MWSLVAFVVLLFIFVQILKVFGAPVWFQWLATFIEIVMYVVVVIRNGLK